MDRKLFFSSVPFVIMTGGFFASIIFLCLMSLIGDAFFSIALSVSIIVLGIGMILCGYKYIRTSEEGSTIRRIAMVIMLSVFFLAIISPLFFVLARALSNVVFIFLILYSFYAGVIILAVGTMVSCIRYLIVKK